MKLYEHPFDAAFDIGEGPVSPDRHIMETGEVSAAAYVSDERFAFDRELFGKVWLCVARAEQLPRNGDWVVRDIKLRATSAIIVRGADGAIRAFHNICSHRGMKLVWGTSGRGGRFSCPYHAWTYDSDGALRNVPDRECFPHLDQAESGLTPIACAVWEGFVFINLSTRPEQSLEEFLGPLGERLAGAPFGDFPYSLTVSQEVEGNWKFGLDAASEGYHVRTLHKATIGNMLATPQNPHVHFLQWEPLGPHQTVTVGGNPDFRLPEMRQVQSFAARNAGQMLVEGGIDGLTSGDFLRHPAINRMEAREFTNDQFMIFPNMSLHITANGYWTTQYWPIAKDRSWWTSTFYYKRPRSAREILALHFAGALQRDVFAEDNSCFQRQQSALASGSKDKMHIGESEVVLRYMAAVFSGLHEARTGMAAA